ncbi:hypothetical protein FISHEDRAFT_59403 [Fistulina hepatica ATCC 64428]|uniref:Uncharacterized protein n=1 Tax=Fistulina hepatica ATCC 64428 TaxID=1128425 RepID=A0A0D7AD03_9AGAR|nr:hypothetical protein FISHEDRAFT_59403 [Fistulina hepatica ATCC 64428]
MTKQDTQRLRVVEDVRCLSVNNEWTNTASIHILRKLLVSLCCSLHHIGCHCGYHDVRNISMALTPRRIASSTSFVRAVTDEPADESPRSVASLPNDSRSSMYLAMSRLPIEVWQDIFVNCLFSFRKTTPHDHFPTTSNAPLSLMSVCHSWRSIAMSLPPLWNHLSITICNKRVRPSIALISDALQRSRALPLHIYIGYQFWASHDLYNEVMVMLLAHTDRWCRVGMFVPPNYAYPLTPASQSAPWLEHLKVNVRSGTPYADVRELLALADRAPLLRKLTIFGVGDLHLHVGGAHPSAFAQITTLKMNAIPSTDAVLVVLGHCKGLVEADLALAHSSIFVGGDGSPYNAIVGPDILFTSTVRLLRLASRRDPLATVLAHLILPKLQDLQLSMLGGEFDGTAPMRPWPTQQFKSLLDRSGGTMLRRLELTGTDVGGTELCDILAHPRLRLLQALVFYSERAHQSTEAAQHRARTKQALIEALMIMPGDDEVLLPALTRLSLGRWHTKGREYSARFSEAIDEMLSSRQPPQVAPGVRTLQYVHVDFWEVKPDILGHFGLGIQHINLSALGW